jgi:hypothetical protein
VAASRIAGNRARITSVERNSVHYFQQPDARHVSVDTMATSLDGVAARFTLAKQRGNTFVNSAFGIISPGFDVNDLGFMYRTGVINMHLGGGRTWTKPGKLFRYAEAGGAVFRSYDWDGNINWSGVFQFGYVQFLNYYGVNWNLAYNPWTVNNRRTRGGPLTLTPPGYQFGLDLGSDSRKRVTANMGGGTYYRSRQDYDWYSYANVKYLPAPNLSVSVGPNLSGGNYPLQYVDAIADSTATATYGTSYVFARLRQTELSAGIRVNWTYSPTLSLQVYAQPLISAGKYDQFKSLARPRSYDFSSAVAPYNPDFNFRSLRGNAVLRWEYMPGSTLYFVWTQSRSASDADGDFRFGSSMGSMLRAPAENIFMIKASYWWNP